MGEHITYIRVRLSSALCVWDVAARLSDGIRACNPT
jgi:hypothetical protein